MRRPLAAALRRATGPRILEYPGLVVLAVAWTLVGTLGYARHYLESPRPGADPEFVPHYLLGLTCYLPWIGLSALVIEIERRFPLGRAGWLRSVAVLAFASVPMAYAAWALTAVLAWVVQSAFGLPATAHRLAWIIPGRELLGHEFLFWSSVAASWVLRTLVEARDNERRASRLMLEKSQLEASLRQAELDALRMRLHPHFLFNSLQNISVLTEHDPATGSRMLTKLGELLRAALARDGRPETTLQAEVALTEAYLAIEQMRFGDRLTTLVDTAPGTERALVPTFLLQPIVENALRHGLQRVRDRGVVAIRSFIEAESLVLTVTDNGAGPPGASLCDLPLGIGLGATCERLARMYPGAHSFSMHAVPAGGTEVRMALPLRFDVSAGASAKGDAVHEEPDVAYAAVADRR